MHFKKNTYWNFGSSQGEDTGQVLSWGRSLANSSNLSWVFTPVRARQQPGDKTFWNSSFTIAEFSLEIYVTN